VLESVDVGQRALAAYASVVDGDILDQLRTLAEDLRGLRVLHVNATSYGGGVSELLRSTVPLLNDLGLVADWRIIAGDPAFFAATKAIHNALQGNPRSLTPEERATFTAVSERNAALLEEVYDVVFVHDPQPVAIPAMRGRGDARWVWRCHIDTSAPNPTTWELLAPYLAAYDAAIFTMAEFVPPSMPRTHVDIVPPAIDPLSPKNRELDDTLAADILAWIGVPKDARLVTQVSRFDPWKDPLGVIAAYRTARDEFPDLQLALIGSMALDDPEGWEVYERVMAQARADPLIHVFTNLTGVGNIEVNAFQRRSAAIVQKSLREGFGLVVSEALWKGTPVIAGRAGGIPLQMADGEGGALVDSVEECARALVDVLAEPDDARRRAEVGRERIRRHFLMPRLVLNELALMHDLVAGDRPMRRSPPGRDPVCGMAITEPSRAPRARYDGRDYSFCSQDCRARFLVSPERYLQPRAGERTQ
jgi:trehalose synthase